MKTREELNALKKEVEALNQKLAELTEEELTSEQKVYFEYTCRGGDYIKTCTVPSPHLNGDDLEREKKMLKL